MRSDFYRGCSPEYIYYDTNTDAVEAWLRPFRRSAWLAREAIGEWMRANESRIKKEAAERFGYERLCTCLYSRDFGRDPATWEPSWGSLPGDVPLE